VYSGPHPSGYKSWLDWRASCGFTGSLRGVSVKALTPAEGGVAMHVPEEPCRPSEQDMMGAIKKPDLRCDEHSDVRATVRELLLWFNELEGRVKALENER
jgi:hypothetical protein